MDWGEVILTFNILEILDLFLDAFVEEIDVIEWRRFTKIRFPIVVEMELEIFILNDLSGNMGDEELLLSLLLEGEDDRNVI